jgi:nucleotide-binding universal stress UspA family protein
MYQKILIPMDGSREAEDVITKIQPELTESTEVILLKVIPPLKGQRLGQLVVTAAEREEAERIKAIDYFRGVINRLEGSPGQWQGGAIVSGSVPEGIASFAAQENVDLIAMYTHDRKGLAKLIRGSVAEKVKQSATTKVRVFPPESW